jgi:hypothetical protein
MQVSKRLGLVCVAMLASGPAAFSQETPPADPKPAPAQPTPAPPNVDLRGQPSLIKHDDKGHLVRPELPPDEAALDLVGLDEGEKAAVTQLLAARGAILDHSVAQNLTLLLKFLGIDSGDTQKEQMQALKDMITKTMGPLREMGSLRDQAAPLLASDKAAKYNDILNNYWAAVSQEDEQTLKAKGQPMTPSQVRGYETMLAYGGEIRRSYERLVEAKADKLGEMLVGIKTTPDQDTKIKAAISDYTAKSQGKPTASQKREVFRNVLKELTYDQRLALLAALYGEKPDAKKPEDAKPEDKKLDDKKTDEKK